MSDNPSSQLSNSNTSSPSSGGGLLDVLSVISSPIAGLINTGLNFLGSAKQKEDSLAQWKRENEYNSPKNQLSRLRDAGLNPALMYQNGASGLISASSPELSKAGQSQLQGVDPLTNAQIANIEAQTEYTQSKTDETKQDTQFSAEEHPFKLSVLQNDVNIGEQTLNHLKAQTSYLGALSAESRERTNKLVQETLELVQGWPSRLQVLYSDARKAQIDYEYYGEQVKLGLESVKALINQYKSNARYLSSLSDYYDGKPERENEQLDINWEELNQSERRLEGQLLYWDELGGHFLRRDIIYGVKTMFDGIQSFSPRSRSTYNFDKKNGRWNLNSGKREVHRPISFGGHSSRF